MVVWLCWCRCWLVMVRFCCLCNGVVKLLCLVVWLCGCWLMSVMMCCGCCRGLCRWCGLVVCGLVLGG